MNSHSNQDLEIAQRVVIDWWNKGVDHIQFRKRSVNNVLAFKVAEALNTAREEGYAAGCKACGGPFPYKKGQAIAKSTNRDNAKGK